MSVASERLRLPPITAEGLSFPPTILKEISLEGFGREERLRVEEFENSHPAQGEPIFTKDAKRLFDRAVIYWPDMDGWALMTQVAQDLKLQIPPAGENSLLETTSLNRWRGVRTMDWLRPYGFSDEMIRGTVIFARDLIDDRLTPALESARERILKMQNG